MPSKDPDIKEYPYGEWALAPLIGRVTIAANNAQHLVLIIFDILVRDGDLARAIFFSLKSDAAQRDITLAAMAVRLRGAPELLERGRKAFQRLADLSGERNAAIHTIWAVEGSNKRYSPAPGAEHHKRLRQDDFEGQFSELAMNLGGMSSVLFELRTDILMHLHQIDGPQQRQRDPDQA